MGLTLSVVGMCYGNAPYIIEALESIAPCDCEVVDWVVIDDGSPDQVHRDRLRDWASEVSLDVRALLHTENVGLPRRLNEALQYLRGDYVIFIADDVFLPGAVDEMVRQVEAVNRPDVLTGIAQFYNEELSKPMSKFYGIWNLEGEYPHVVGGLELQDRIVEYNFLSAPATLWKVSSLKEVGGYDIDFSFEDWPILLKLSSRITEFRLAFSGHILVKYRRIPPSEKWLSPGQKKMRDRMYSDTMLMRLRYCDRSRRHHRAMLYKCLCPYMAKGDVVDLVWSSSYLKSWFPISRFFIKSSRGRSLSLGYALAMLEGKFMK